MLAERSLPPEAWCEVVGALELGLNTAVSDSTGSHLLKLALGEMPRLPVDLIVGTDSARGVPECSHAGEGHQWRKHGSSWRRHKSTRRGTMMLTIASRTSKLDS